MRLQPSMTHLKGKAENQSKAPSEIKGEGESDAVPAPAGNLPRSNAITQSKNESEGNTAAASVDCLSHRNSIKQSTEPMSFAFGAFADSHLPTTPRVYKISKAPSDTRQGQALLQVQAKLSTMGAAVNLIPDWYNPNRPHPHLQDQGARNFFAEDDMLNDCGLDVMLRPEALLPCRVWQKANAVNMRAHTERFRPDNLRLGVNFHQDAGGRTQSLIMPIVSARRIFLYSPEDFLKAGRCAAEQGLTIPASKNLEGKYPGLAPVGVERYHDMGPWFKNVYPKLVEAGVGPTYVTDVSPGETLAFDRTMLHGTLDFGEPWSVLVNFF